MTNLDGNTKGHESSLPGRRIGGSHVGLDVSVESGEDLGGREGLGENVENSEGKLEKEEKGNIGQFRITESGEKKEGRKGDSLEKASPRRCPRDPPLDRWEGDEREWHLQG